MHEYFDIVKQYIQDNFTPSDPDKANFRQATNGMLQFLFDVFPSGCISDYDLNDILTELGYTRYNYIVENMDSKFSGKGENRKEIITISKNLVNGWCLKSHLDLKNEVREIAAPK